jgi:hypothetical protein
MLNSSGAATLITPFRFVSQEQKFYCWWEFQERNKQQLADLHRARVGVASPFSSMEKRR